MAWQDDVYGELHGSLGASDVELGLRPVSSDGGGARVRPPALSSRGEGGRAFEDAPATAAEYAAEVETLLAEEAAIADAVVESRAVDSDGGGVRLKPPALHTHQLMAASIDPAVRASTLRLCAVATPSGVLR